MLYLYHYMYLLMYEQLGNRFPMFESFYIPSGYSHNLYLTLKPIIQCIISRSICFIPSIPKIKQIIKAPTYIELHVCRGFCYLLLSVLLLLAASLSLFTSPTVLTAYFPPLSHTAIGAGKGTSQIGVALQQRFITGGVFVRAVVFNTVPQGRERLEVCFQILNHIIESTYALIQFMQFSHEGSYGFFVPFYEYHAGAVIKGAIHQIPCYRSGIFKVG